MPIRLCVAASVAVAVCLALFAVRGSATQKAVQIKPVLATAPVTDDPDDPAIWVNTSDPGRSLIFGTNKVKAPKGALVAYGLDGTIRQVFAGLDRPNNVDVERALWVGGLSIDVAVVTERLKRRLRVFRIAPDGSGFSDISSIDQLGVFNDRSGEAAAPMGIGLYRRQDGAIFAIVSSKTGPREGYLQEYRLEGDGAGRVKARWVRTFGRFSGVGEIEAIAVDDFLGYVYYADEGDGIHKYYADPDHADAGRELAHFGRTGFSGDREGIAIYARDGTTGYIVCTDQIDGNSEYHIYRREGARGNPHDHSELVKVVAGGADATDGIDITSWPLSGFPRGLVVAMNSKPRNFLLYRWEDVADAGLPTLQMSNWPRRDPSVPPITPKCQHDWSRHSPNSVHRELARGDTLPREIKRVEPTLPEAVRKAVQGVCILEVLINEEGEIESVCVLRGLRPDVDAEIVKAVRQWRFAPAISRGKAVPVVMTITDTIPPKGPRD